MKIIKFIKTLIPLALLILNILIYNALAIYCHVNLSYLWISSIIILVIYVAVALADRHNKLFLRFLPIFPICVIFYFLLLIILGSLLLNNFHIIEKFDIVISVSFSLVGIVIAFMLIWVNELIDLIKKAYKFLDSNVFEENCLKRTFKNLPFVLVTLPVLCSLVDLFTYLYGIFSAEANSFFTFFVTFSLMLSAMTFLLYVIMFISLFVEKISECTKN